MLPDAGTAAWPKGTPLDRSIRTVESVADLLTWLVDVGLGATILLVPLFMGGRIALGQFLLVSLAFLVALFWCLRQSLAPASPWTRSAATPLLLAALALVIFQLLPLSPQVLHAVSPNLDDLLPLWNGANESASLGNWQTVSLAPWYTRGSLISLTAFVLIFTVVLQRVERVEDVERLLRCVAFVTASMAIFALIHYFTTNGKYFWFYEYPFSTPASNVAGSFTNRNHFANFMALGIGPLVWWIQDALGRATPAETRGKPDAPATMNANWHMAGLRALLLGFVVFAGLLSLSRGGAVAMTVAFTLSLLILCRRSQVQRKTLAVMGVSVLVLGSCLYIYGHGRVTSRLDDFRSVDTLDRNQGRRKLWQVDLTAARDFAVCGTGLGTHREIYPLYVPSAGFLRDCEFTHAENGYVQVLLETGAVGTVLLLWAAGLCIYWCAACVKDPRNPRQLACIAAIGPTIAASFVHSCGDFVWYVPGCMVTVVVLAACACRLRQLNVREERETKCSVVLPRYIWIVAGVFLAASSYVLLRDQGLAVQAESHWHRYVRLSKVLSKAEGEERRETLRSMLHTLSRVVALQPGHARAYSQLASVHIQLFGSSQDTAGFAIDVPQVRQAVVASKFQSRQAMRTWLAHAFADCSAHLDAAHGHAHRAAQACPVQGAPYTYLAQLSFLDGPDLPGTVDYFRQASLLRPFDGQVLIAAGQEAVLTGEPDQAVGFWNQALHADRASREQLLRTLASHVAAESILEKFFLDEEALKYLLGVYGKLGNTDGRRIVREYYAERCVQNAGRARGTDAARQWLDAAETYAQMGNATERVRCLENAVSHDPQNYGARLALGKCLCEVNRFAEAEPHLLWCLRYKPHDARLRALVEKSVDNRLRAPR